MMSEIGARSLIRGKDDYSDELEMLMREQQRRKQQEASDIERELNIYRSGSAPPTTEGSLDGLIGGRGVCGGGLFEEEMRSDPAYIKYYYSHVNLNPRLPPPLFSKEDWRLSQRFLGGGSVGGNRRLVNGLSVNEEGGGDGSLFAVQPEFAGKKMEMEMETGSGDGLIGLPENGLGQRQKSFLEIIQGNSGDATTMFGHLSRPSNRAFDNVLESSEPHHTNLQPNRIYLDSNIQSFQKTGSLASQTYASTLVASLSRSTTPQDMDVHEDLVSAFSGLNLSMNSNQNAQIHPQNPLEKYSDSYLKSPSTPLLYTGSNSPSQFLNFDSPNGSFSTFDLGAGVMNPSSPSLSTNPIGCSNMLPMGGRLNLRPNNLASDMQVQMMDPMYLQYSRSTDYNTVMDRQSLDTSSMEMLELQKSYLESFLLLQNSQYGLPYVNKPGRLNNGYYGNTANSLGLIGSVLPHSPIGSGNLDYVLGPLHLEHRRSRDESFSLSLLDQFKNTKTKCFELSEIAGHVVEFSVDQYGSRFIQQKLETASAKEKDMVFLEITPNALSLMTDLFGNYVIQKFLEHGNPSHIRKLADQLIGNVSELSLHMYGCRVIQKAIEVVDLDQKIKMVKELEGNVVRCVWDQNGNHVIQKCIECIPEDAIQFIISTFYDQIVTFSSHPYGCRVIQRILENCRDQKTQSKVMDEILQSVCMLAQDQYGNYVVQHVLEHGQAHERSIIISKFIGQIVQMSQQKFASNVVEKCLTFGSVEERQTLVNEMLGSSNNDNDEPLQVMMKDQFANYVVQKVLETCDDKQLKLILNRIKLHLNTLKKYTYGKHIVARVEKLVVAGERRIGILASSQSAQIS